jgi:integrase
MREEPSKSVVSKFTKTFVDRATNDGARQRLYWEDALRGFGLRVGAKAKTFFVQREVNGITKRFTLDRYGVLTVEEAREKARKALEKMRGGIDPKAEREAKAKVEAARGLTLRQAFELYASAKDRDPRTVSDYQYSLEHYLDDWLDRPLLSLGTDAGRAEVHEQHLRIARDVARGAYAIKNKKGKARPHKKRNGETTADHAMHAFRAIWNRAMRQHAELPVSPTINIDWFRPPTDRSPIPYELLPKWHAGVTAIDNAARRDLLLVIILTGLRSNDAKTMRWENVDFARRALFVPDPKTGGPFELPLSDYLLDLLAKRQQQHKADLAKKLLPKHAAPWVFGAWSKSGHVIEVREKIEGVPFAIHELRNTFSTVAEFKAGVPEKIVSVFMRHGQPRRTMTQRYQKVRIDDLRAPMQAITDTFLALFRENPPAKVIPLKRKRG